MKKKVLFLITNLANGGAEKVLVNLVNNIDQNKYDVTVMTIFDSGVHIKNLADHIHYKTFFKKTFHGIRFITAFLPAGLLHRTFIKNFSYDIEVAYLEGPPAKIISGCKNKSTKLVSWIHIELNDKRSYIEGYRNQKDATNSYNRFNKIICVSETVKKRFMDISGITSSKIDVLYNTNETEKIKIKSLETVDDFSFNDMFTICSVAKIEESKGFDRLIQVHKRLLDEGYQHRVILLGIGSKENEYKEEAKRLGIEDSFILLGYRENPYKYVKNSDLYVCSSRREGFSTAVTEALVVGTPVVSTECSGAKELLGNNNEYGLVVENSTEGVYLGIKTILENKDLYTYYKQQSGIRGSYFSKEKTVKSVEEMFENL